MSNMFYILGASMAQVIGREEMTCRGLLRLTIIDSVAQLRQSSDPNQATAYMKTMAYQDWEAILEGPVLAQRLTSIGIKEVVSVVARLKRTLAEKQSLLTMSAR